MGHKLGKKAAFSFNEGWFLVWFSFNFVRFVMDMKHGSVWDGLGLVWLGLIWFGLDLDWTWSGPGLV